MDWVWFLFSFKGRVNRAKYWLGHLVILAWTLLVFWLAYAWLVQMVGGHSRTFSTDFGINELGPYFRLNLAETDQATGHTVYFGLDRLLNLLGPATYHSLSRADILPIIFNVAATAPLVWLYLAISVKRLHDRNRSGWWMLPFALLPALLQHYADALPNSHWLIPLAVASFILPMWAFVELGCLEGTGGTNRFGPNPLSREPSRRSAETRLRATTA